MNTGTQTFKATALYEHGRAFNFEVIAFTIMGAARQAAIDAPQAISITVEPIPAHRSTLS